MFYDNLGFGNWKKKDYNLFLKGLLKFGRKKIVEIAHLMVVSNTRLFIIFFLDIFIIIFFFL
jgi:hypothetical protein